MNPPPRTTTDAYAWGKAIERTLQHGPGCLSCCVEAARAVVEARDRQWQAKQREEGEELMLTNDMILTPTELRARLAAAEATGRTAVRRLAEVTARNHGSADDAARCTAPHCRDVTAVLATATAQAWLREAGQDG